MGDRQSLLVGINLEHDAPDRVLSTFSGSADFGFGFRIFVKSILAVK
jgi:hypothetical protein